MAEKADFDGIFARLKAILQEYELELSVKSDEPGNYSLNTPFSETYQKEIYFGSVQIKKDHVSYYLMPIYWYPDLLDEISPSLKARLDGKSSFRFETSDEETFSALSLLTRRGAERFRDAQYI
jgi:hypothetical protein